jgi:hypothetical protein
MIGLLGITVVEAVSSLIYSLCFLEFCNLLGYTNTSNAVNISLCFFSAFLSFMIFLCFLEFCNLLVITTHQMLKHAITNSVLVKA